jgi:hypothetical protein
LRNTAGAIQGRSARVCHVVEAEMDNYEPCIYTKRVLEAVKVLRDQVMSKFAQRVDVAVNALSTNSAKDVDENDFIDASRLVYDGVREIRRAVLMNRVSFTVTNNYQNFLRIFTKFHPQKIAIKRTKKSWILRILKMNNIHLKLARNVRYYQIKRNSFSVFASRLFPYFQFSL